MWASTKNLVQLIIQDQLEVIKKLLQPYSLNTKRKIILRKDQHCSLLFIAVLKQRVSIVDYLLVSCKADPNDVGLFNGEICPCLLVAAMQNDMQILNCLIKNGADVNVTNVYHRTALFMAAYNKNDLMLRYLVAKGADVNLTDYKGTTCLMVALGNDVISRFLINSGAHINRVNHDGKTALMLAAENQNMKGLSFLLSCGVDINFKNDYGESAAFIAVMNNQWHIVREFERIGLITNMLEAEVYEIRSCQKVIREDPEETILLWKKAVLLRNLPIYTPLFGTYSSCVLRQDRDWILSNFDPITGSALLFMVSRWNLLNPHTLTILRDAICQIESPAIFVILYRNFLQSVRAANDQLFEKSYLHINLMTYHFLLKWGGSTKVLEMFKSVVLQIENLFQRIHTCTEIESLPLVFQVSSYLNIFINILKKTASLAINITDLTEEIKTVVKLDNARFNDRSLLHLCILNEYPMPLTRLFLKCGAGTNRVDKFKKTAVHYMLESNTYTTKEAVNIFLKYGFKPEKFKDGFCLPCALRKKNMLEKPVRYMTLSCLAAKVVGEKLPYENKLPISYQNIIYSHF